MRKIANTRRPDAPMWMRMWMWRWPNIDIDRATERGVDSSRVESRRVAATARLRTAHFAPHRISTALYRLRSTRSSRRTRSASAKRARSTTSTSCAICSRTRMCAALAFALSLSLSLPSLTPFMNPTRVLSSSCDPRPRATACATFVFLRPPLPFLRVPCRRARARIVFLC